MSHIAVEHRRACGILVGGNFFGREALPQPQHHHPHVIQPAGVPRPPDPLAVLRKVLGGQLSLQATFVVLEQGVELGEEVFLQSAGDEVGDVGEGVPPPGPLGIDEPHLFRQHPTAVVEEHVMRLRVSVDTRHQGLRQFFVEVPGFSGNAWPKCGVEGGLGPHRFDHGVPVLSSLPNVHLTLVPFPHWPKGTLLEVRLLPPVRGVHGGQGLQGTFRPGEGESRVLREALRAKVLDHQHEGLVQGVLAGRTSPCMEMPGPQGRDLAPPNGQGVGVEVNLAAGRLDEGVSKGPGGLLFGVLTPHALYDYALAVVSLEGIDESLSSTQGAPLVNTAFLHIEHLRQRSAILCGQQEVRVRTNRCHPSPSGANEVQRLL
eukprot:Sspe_Gene.66139::Locus_39095_Transcript_1_1_Confidence_1.000_Length_1195::g.66139::m.66139